MLRSRVLLSVSLLALLTINSVADDAVMRLKLPSSIFFGSGGGETETPPDGDGNGDPEDPQISPLELLIGNPFPAWATVGDQFTTSLSVSGGTPGYVVDVIGTRPTGLNVSGLSFGGTFLQQGLFSFRLRATDAASPALTDILDQQTIEVADPLLLDAYPAVIQATRGVETIVAAPAVQGGTPPYLFELAGEGAALGSGGVVTVTPQATGILGPYVVTVIDQRGREDVGEAFTLNVSDPLGVAYPAPSYVFQSGVAANVPAPTVTGGRGAKNFAAVSGSLPASMTLQADGSVVGTPTSPCTDCSFSIGVTDVDGRSASASVGYSIVSPIAITLTAPGPLRVGQAVNIPVTATGGQGVITLSSTGDLPPGLSVSGSAIVGTVGVVPATTFYSFQLHATNTAGSGSGWFQFEAHPALTASMAAATFTSGTASSSSAPVSTGGLGTLAWSLAPGSIALPSGLTLNAATGVISSTTAAVTTGTFTGVKLRVTDTFDMKTADTGSFTITVAGPLSVSVGTITGRRSGATLNAPITASGGVGTITLSTTGTVPPGISISGNALTGTFGTVSSITTYTFNVVATNSSGSKSTSVSIELIPVLAVSSVSNWTVQSGTTASTPAPTVTGRKGTATWSLAVGSGSLPAGLTLNSSTGVISSSSTLVTPNTYSGLKLRVTDSFDSKTADTPVFTITITGQSCSSVPFGSALAHTGTLTAWQSSSVPYGSTCQSEIRTCNNGSLSGSYTNQSCAAQPATIDQIYPTAIRSMLSSLGIPGSTVANAAGPTTFTHNLNGSVTVDQNGNVTQASTTNVAYFGNYCTTLVNILKGGLSTAQQGTLWVYGFTSGTPSYRSDLLSNVTSTACRLGKGNYTSNDPTVSVRPYQ